MLQLAAVALAHRIGETAWRLSPEARERYPAVPWRAIRGMRNLVAHDDGRIDHMILWNTLRDDFPRLAAELRGDP